MKTLSFISALFLFGVMTVSCNNDQSVRHDMKHVEEEKETLREEIRDVRRKIDVRLTQLGREMETAGEEAKVEIKQEMTKLEGEGRKFDAKLDEISRETEETWRQFKQNVREAIDDLKRDLES